MTRFCSSSQFDPRSSRRDGGHYHYSDFNAKEDTFAFDAVGRCDDSFGANFVNKAAAKSGSPSAGAKGKHVVVITDPYVTSR
ncbi:hypothetical protein AB0V79_27800 [Mesorhizobium ciceri]|nr:hypothetical protein [Mesorhizobium ciceri]AMX98974.1 hypothetical protein A4R29_05375 [Mesorhizobium ciceri biovar biserrulae]